MSSMNTRSNGSNSNGFQGGAPGSIVHGDSPAVSELTTPSQATRGTQSASYVRRVEDVSLFDLAANDNEAISPVRRIVFSPEEEEEMWENAQRHDHPGAGDFDEEDEDGLGNASSEAAIDRIAHDDEIERAVEVGDSWADYVASYQDEMDMERAMKKMEQMNASLSISIPGAPVGWLPPSAPDDWTPQAKKLNKKEPAAPFESLDNPGKWSKFVYRPKFASKGGHGDYVSHTLPTGATPVPETNGKRSVGDFDFFYQGWQKEILDCRSGASRDNMWPANRKGSLDANTLTKLGMSRERMTEEADGQPDALFFHQLILSIHNIDNTKILTVEQDPRNPFYSNVARWTNMCACEELGILGGGYGHDFKPTSPI